MNINRNNYEIWMIDYFDGKLSAIEVTTFMAFLEANPDLKEEFEIFDLTPVDAIETNYSDKEALKKPIINSEAEITEDNYETFFIGHFEKDLSSSEEILLQAFLQKNPHLNDEFKIHEAMFLEADSLVVYPQKEALKRKPRIGIYWWPASVAAAIIILFSISGLFEDTAIVPGDAEPISISYLQTQNLIVTISGQAEPELLVFANPDVSQLELTFQDEPESIEIITITSIPAANYDMALVGDEIPAPHFWDNYGQTDDLAFAIPPEEPTKKKNLFGKVIKNFAGKMSGNLPESKQKEKNKKEPGFVKMLDQSITVFNTITGGDTELVKSYDQNGNLKHYQVDGETLSWSRNISATPPGVE